MNANNKNRAKSRPSLERPHQNSSLQNRSQIRPKPSNERPMTPEGVYFNARLMHCTTSLVGCVVQIQTKDGTRYEGVLRTFSPEFELVVDYVTKIETNSVPISGTNIANLLVSLEAKNTVSQRLIFKFQDVVKLNATNVDLEFAANKGHVLTDSEISRYDSKQSRDKDLKELVPWDGGHTDLDEALDDCNGVDTQNGWCAEEMFKVNETKFQVKSTYDPSLPDYTCALTQGTGADYEEKERSATELAQSIENDPGRTARYAKEDADDEEKYSAVVRPNDEDKYSAVVRPNDTQHNRNQERNRNRKSNNSPNSNTYSNNNSGGSAAPGLPQRQPRGNMSSGGGTAPTPFHSNKNPNYNKHYTGGNGGTGYSNAPSHKGQSYRDEHMSFPIASQTYSKSGDTEESSHPNAGQQRGRESNENRRPTATNKRKEDVTADLKKFSNDFKLPSNVSNEDIPKEKDTVSQKSESHPKHPNVVQSARNKSAPGGGDSIPVKDKSIESVGPHSGGEPPIEKDSREVRDSSDPKDSVDSSVSTTGAAPEPEIAKKSTLNPNAKTFTPRSPMGPLTTSATPPSVASTPSSTVSVPISSQLTHAGPHSLSQGHSQQTSIGPTQSATHASQPRFQNPLVQIPHQYNVLTPGLTPLLAHNQYLTMTNVATMPSFAPSNHNQQRNYRTKGPQQYQNVRHEFTQQNAHVAAAVTGHPVLAAAPIGAPQQVSYGPQQTTAMVQQGHPQHMYQHMYQFQPRMALPQHSAAMQMAVPQAVQYDPAQLQHIYTGAVQLQHLVSQAHQHMTNSGPHSGHSTPQSQTPTTPLHGGPAPSPVHHQPNQPPTPTPQQPVMYANVSTAHNQQNANVGHHTSSGPYHNIVILPTGQAMSQHHSGGHGGQLHGHLGHSTQANHSGGPALVPVHLITSSNAQNQLAATFNPNSGV